MPGEFEVDIHKLMADLGRMRPVFHSEADFQHALAWELQRQWPDARVRLEKPVTVDDSVLHLDMWVEVAARALAIELKYKTAALNANVNGEQFWLANHSAQPPGRYDYILDIERLERVTMANPRCTGWAILLTNEALYWRSGTGGQVVDPDFRLEEGRTLTGTLAWGKGASAGTMKNRERPLALHGRYSIHWEPYARGVAERSGEFRFLALQIVPMPTAQ
jgi:hypothetical protein